jgi:hypothetical protein
LLSDVEALLVRKRATEEWGRSAPVASINTFIERELDRLEHAAPLSSERCDVLPLLDEVFHQSLREAWAVATNIH